MEPAGRRRGGGERARGAGRAPTARSRGGAPPGAAAATSAGSPGSAAPTWSSISAKGSTATPGSRTTSSGTLELAGVPFTGLPPLGHHDRPPEARRQHAALGGRPPRARLRARPGQQDPGRLPAPGHREAVGGRRQRRDRQRRGLHLQAGAQEARRPHAGAVRGGAGPGVRRPAGSSTSGSSGKRMLPIAEIRFDGMPEGTWPIVGYAAKWIPGSPEDEGTLPICPADVRDGAERRDRQGGPRRLGVRLRRRGLRPGGPPGQRGRAAVRARGESVPRPLQQRRTGPDGPGLRLELRRPGDARGGRSPDALPEPNAAAALVSGVSAA